MSKLEAQLEQQLKMIGIKGFEREYRFAAIHVGLGKGIRDRLALAGLKNWRFDFAHVGKKFAVEVEGGGWSGGRHTRGKGFAEDLKKYQEAMRLGWTVYRCDGQLIKSGEALEIIEHMLGVRQ